MHMVLFTWWSWHICKEEGVGVDVDKLMGKRNDGRTVRQYNSFLSRESAALFGLEGRTADGSPLGCGQSASVLKNHPERLFLWLGLKVGLRTVRPRGADGPRVT